MRKSYALLIALFFCGILLESCGKKKQDEGVNEEEMMGAMEGENEERASPLLTTEGTVGGKKISIQYGAPSVKGRVIWGDLVPYEEVWRTGANEATYLSFSEDLIVEGERLPAGKYSLFTIPKEDEDWTLIFNSEWNLKHGHYQYDEDNDVLRVEVSPQWVEESQEQLSFEVKPPGIVIKWEKLVFPITVE
ncbi:DUF2911 domain-containing protein [Echinicola jeungdonensis]|uniref:DUF2911 domain-containing protein n=1 Tax=Echinicola jeungdonensis TaxID=709343 RepID=A0ABV5J2R3_9BACT|nr:DUF2911 domain-containing protein [Echinicola jeungdonensis]MDN3668141.1 DUF2911 domain-containing protein [Echinicola jeungdonensis]